MRSSTVVALAASISAASAVNQGFNYGSTQTDGSIKDQSAFQDEFAAAKGLVGNSGFTSARIYTTIQGGTTNTPIAAIPAAIAEGTSLLLGIWASGGQTGIDNEIAALKSAISQYGTSFTSLVVGLSVGSEDLYRISPTGIAADSGVGADPDTLVSYISQVRSALSGTALSGVSIGHVDTWTAWVNGSNSAVINAVDWIGTDAYPYFQNTMSNSIDDGSSLFFDAYDATVAVAGSKEVWITETGWPVSGSAENLAVASIANAKTYWDGVACKVLGNVNTYWYTLQDAYPTTPSPSFGLVGSTLSTTPLYDLTCNSTTSSSSSSAASSATSDAGSATSATSAASSASIDVAGASSLAASATPTGGLSPAQGAGNGVPSSAEASASAASSGSAASASGLVPIYTNGTATVSSTAVSTGTGSGSGSGSGSSTSTGTSPSTFSGVAVANSGSIVGGVIGSIFAILAAL